MPTSVAIRLGVEGGAEVKRVLTETGQDGQAAFQKIAAASDAAGAAVDRQTAKFQRMAAAAREAETQARAQANINAVLGVGQAPTGSARDSASVFELQARAADEAARRAEVLSREVATLQSRFDPMAAAGARYSAALADIARAEEIGALSAGRAAAARLAAVRSFEDSTQRLERAGVAQKASAQAMVNGQMIVPNRAADVAAYGDELDRLRAKYSPLFAAQREYLGQLAEIRQAVRTGALTQAEGAAAIQGTKDAFARQVGDLRARGDGRLTANQAQGLFYQGTDIVASAASGMSPMTILLQQGGQIAPIFAGPGSASVKGALGQASEAVAGFVKGIGFVGGAIGVVTTAAVAGTAAVLSYQSSMRETERALAGAGRASGATAVQINAAAQAAAASGEVSVRQARQFAAEYASSGRIGVEMYAGLARTARDYAATTNQDVGDANSDLAKAFGNPDLVRGLDTLNEKLGFLDDRTRETVRRLAEQGDRLGAQRIAFDAYAAALTKASELTGAFGDKTSAFGRVFGNVWDMVGEKLDKVFTGGTLDERIKDLQAQLEQTESMRGRFGGLFDYRVDAPANELRAAIARLRGIQSGQTEQTERAQTAQRSREIGDIVRSLDPERAQFDQLRDRVERLRRAISEPVRFGLDSGQLGQVQTQFERLQNLTQSMREDMERFGSATAAAGFRAAQNANANVGLNPVDRAVAERNQRLETDLRDKGLNNLSTREQIDREFAERARAPGLDVPELAALQAEREARLRSIAEREALTSTAKTEIDTIRRSAEEAAKRTAVSGDFISAMINVESRGRADAKNPNSSATGLGQFIEGTWERLFRDRFPERAAGMSREAILDRRTNREDSIELIKVYAAENQRALEKAGLETSNRNQYLAWFAGAQGAIRLLRADPGTDATSILGQKAANANPTVIPGRTAGQVINWADRVINRNAPGVASTEREAIILRSQITTTDQTTEAAARLAKVQELLNDARSRGTEVGRQFTTAQEVMAAKSEKLTDTARNERQAMLDVADAYATAQASLQRSQLGRDILFERAQIGRTQSEQAVASRLRGSGLGLDSAEADALRLNDNMRALKDTAGSAFSGMLSDLRQGVTLSTMLTNVTGRFADKLLQTASDRVISSLFDGLMGGKGGAANSNGFLGTIASFFGTGKFDGGGYTGSGGRYDVAGIVHRGEVVYSQDDVARHGGVAVVEAIRRGGLRGYADGGIVGRGAFTMPSRAAAGPANDAIPNIAFINTGTPQEQKAPARWGTDEQGRRRIEMVTGDAFAAGAGTPQGREALAQGGRRYVR